MPKPRKKLRPLPRLDQTHKEILGFVKTKERVQNLEVFNQFAHISRRTMKRKLSELIKANAIKRFTDGKKVFYFPA
jgi:predicted HTH transcriptional regulator